MEIVPENNPIKPIQIWLTWPIPVILLDEEGLRTLQNLMKTLIEGDDDEKEGEA